MTIGICGCDRGCGVTHLAIALSNYCASKLRMSTACLELNDTHALRKLTTFSAVTKPKRSKEGHDYISIYGAHYYPDVDTSMIPEFLNAGYLCLLLDFGTLTGENMGEFLRCDSKIVIGSLSPWKRSISNTLQQIPLPVKNYLPAVHCFILYGETVNILKQSAACHLSIRSVPFFPDPFHIEKDLFSFLQSML